MDKLKGVSHWVTDHISTSGEADNDNDIKKIDELGISDELRCNLMSLLQHVEREKQDQQALQKIVSLNLLFATVQIEASFLILFFVLAVY